MKVKDVKELLNQFPDDMDFIITHHDGDGYCYETEFNITQKSVNHCTYSTTSVTDDYFGRIKVNNDIDYYSFEDICLIKDMINGKWEYIELPMKEKEVVVLEF